MTNQEIFNRLVFERDALLNKLSSRTLSELFTEEYESIVSGKSVIISDDDEDIKDELEQLQNDRSNDAAFREKVNLVNRMNENGLINCFIQDWTRLLDLIAMKQMNANIQTAFIFYDAYDLPQSNSLALYGIKDYPEFSIPKYLDSSVCSNELLVIPDAFNFADAWPDCKEYDWTSFHLDVYYDLHNLFKLNSRVILHKALAKMENEGKLKALTPRPFYFYIAEHDLEVRMLYKL